MTKRDNRFKIEYKDKHGNMKIFGEKFHTRKSARIRAKLIDSNEIYLINPVGEVEKFERFVEND